MPHVPTARRNAVQPGQTYTGPEVSRQEPPCPRLSHVPAAARAWQRSKRRRGRQRQDTDPALGPGTATGCRPRPFPISSPALGWAPSPNDSLRTSPVQSDSPQGLIPSGNGTDIKAPSFQTVLTFQRLWRRVSAGSGGFGETGPRAAPVPSQWRDTPWGRTAPTEACPLATQPAEEAMEGSPSPRSAAAALGPIFLGDKWADIMLG